MGLARSGSGTESWNYGTGAYQALEVEPNHGIMGLGAYQALVVDPNHGTRSLQAEGSQLLCNPV